MRRLAALFVVIVSLPACADPVHSAEVDALGGEAPGVRQGPMHRPGQPCLLCHDGSLGDPESFSVAGTVYQLPNATTPATGVRVHLRDSTGVTHDVTTNSVGNFYVLSSTWTPNYPMGASVYTAEGTAVLMRSHIGRDGSCAACHTEPAGPSSPGHVCLEPADGGAPP